MASDPVTAVATAAPVVVAAASAAPAAAAATASAASTAAVIAFYTKMSDYTLLACAVAPVLSCLYYGLMAFCDSLSGHGPDSVTPDGQLISKEEMRQRDETEEAEIKAGASGSAV